jgi:hypothetical protein
MGKARSLSRAVVSLLESQLENSPPRSQGESEFTLQDVTVQFELGPSGTLGLVTVNSEHGIGLTYSRLPSELLDPPPKQSSFVYKGGDTTLRRPEALELVFGPRLGVNLGIVNLVAMPVWSFSWGLSNR